MNHTELRALMARMEEQVSAAGATPLTAAWDSLKSHLAIGPAPDTRPCPHCSRTIMSAATLCGYCWAKLEHAQKES